MYEIEKGIPMPRQYKTRPKGLSYGRIYPFPDMEIGDSFYIPNGYYERIQSGLYKSAKFCGAKIAVRKTEDGGLRVWRTE